MGIVAGMGKKNVICSLCQNKIGDFKYSPMPQWNLSGSLCSKCYSKKLSEYYMRS
jgi:hypothetical protein